MVFKAKSVSRLMLFFLFHKIAVTALFFFGLEYFKKEFDAYTLQTFSYFLIFLPPVALFLTAHPAKLNDLFFLTPLGPINAVLSAVIALSSMPLLCFFSLLPTLVFKNAAAEAVPRYFTAPFHLVLLTTALLPALFEEFVFRGVLLNKRIDMPLQKKIFLSAFFFSVAHLEPQQFLYTFVAGVLFAGLMYVTRSIFASVTAHFTLNAFSTWLMYAASQTDISGAAETASFFNMLLALLIIFAITLPVLLFAIYLLILHNKEKIAFEALILSLRKIAQNQNAALTAAAALNSAPSENGAFPESENVPAPQADKLSEKAQNKTLCLEFWLIVIIYIAYTGFNYYYDYIYMPS